MALRKPDPVITINPLFKLLILINTLLCVVSLAVMLVVGMFAPEQPSSIQQRLYGACENIFTLTAGAFIGLLGGRAAGPDKIEDATST